MSTTIATLRQSTPIAMVYSVLALMFGIVFFPLIFESISESSFPDLWPAYIMSGSCLSIGIVWFIGFSYKYNVKLFDDHILIWGTDTVFGIRYQSDKRSTIKKFKSMLFKSEKSIRLLDIKSIRRNNLDTSRYDHVSSFIEVETNDGMIFSISYNKEMHEGSFIHDLFLTYISYKKNFAGDCSDYQITQYPKFFPMVNINYGEQGSSDNFPWFDTYSLIVVFIWVMGFLIISGVISLLMYLLSVMGTLENIIGYIVVVSLTLLFSVILSYYFRSIPINPEKVKFLEDMPAIEL